MTREGISIYEEAKSNGIARDEFLNAYILTALGTISGVDSKTGLATVRVYVNNPVRVYEEYKGVEILLPGGITLPLSGCPCIVFAPRTPLFINEEVRLYNAGRPYDKQALKAIPIWLPSSVAEVGAGYSGARRFSMYTPFGDISASEEGLGIQYNTEEAKAGFFIDDSGVLHVFNGFTWIQLNNTNEVLLHSENDDTTTEVHVTPKGINLKVKKTPETEDEDEVDYHLTSIGEDGSLQVSVIGEEKTSSIELTPSAENKFTVVTSGDTPTELLAIETDSEGTLTVKQGGSERAVFNDSEGISVTDKSNNTVEMTANGISVTDKSNNTVEMTANGISVTDKSNNTVEMTTNGISVTDKSNNKVEMTTNGISVTDKSNNKVEMTTSGIMISDANSHKIEMSSTKVTITGTMGSLEIT